MVKFCVLLTARAAVLAGFGPMYVGDWSFKAGPDQPAYPMAATAPAVFDTPAAAMAAAAEWNAGNPSNEHYSAAAMGWDPECDATYSLAFAIGWWGRDQVAAIEAAKRRHPSYVG